MTFDRIRLYDLTSMALPDVDLRGRGTAKLRHGSCNELTSPRAAYRLTLVEQATHGPRKGLNPPSARS
jgi:hypothetical protein